MTFMIIKLNVWGKEYAINYSLLGAILLLLIIFTISFAVGFNNAEASVGLTLTKLVLEKNESAWRLLELNLTDLAAREMSMSLELCNVYLGYPFQGHFDTYLYVRMYHICNVLFAESANLQREINPNSLIIIGNTTFNLSNCRSEYRTRGDYFLGQQISRC